ncbi:MAG: hypothetical protein AAFN77_08460 [Planctomycetota bacterium]
MWFSLFVPGLLFAIWIWPQLKMPRIWLTLFLLALIGTMVWVSMDLNEFIAARSSSNGSPRRVLYLVLSETDLPFVQLTIGFFAATLSSWQVPKRGNTEKE